MMMATGLLVEEAWPSWFRELDLNGGPWFKSSTLPLSGFVLGSPEFNSSTALCK